MKLADLDARKASQTPFEFEFELDGEPTGVFLSVYGAQAPEVQRELERLLDTRREKEAAAQIAGKTMTVRSDVEFRHEAAAARLAGWRGLDDAFSREGALTLCQGSIQACAQIIEKSDRIGNFMQLSPKKSSPSPKPSST